MDKLETGTMLSLWHDILNRFNEVSKAMQKSDVLLSTVDVMLMTFKSDVWESAALGYVFDDLAIDTAMDERSTFRVSSLFIA